MDPKMAPGTHPGTPFWRVWWGLIRVLLGFGPWTLPEWVPDGSQLGRVLSGMPISIRAGVLIPLYTPKYGVPVWVPGAILGSILGPFLGPWGPKPRTPVDQMWGPPEIGGPRYGPK